MCESCYGPLSSNSVLRICVCIVREADLNYHTIHPQEGPAATQGTPEM